MKKRMFITTIVMMLVLAVALTTSSLAWFSSANTTVTANAATFTAATAGTSNVNLKISDTTGGWSNQIGLTTGARTMSGLVPTAPLISATELAASDYTTTGVTKNGAHVDVIHKGYVWPATMSFNLAKIGSESNFVIDDGDNAVETYASTARKASTNYYYDYFYIHNADSQNSLSSLTFKVDSTISVIAEGQTGYEAGDYTARGYVAFILFDAINYAVGQSVATNALFEAGSTVVASDTTELADGQVKESSEGAGYTAWVPFCAFTFATKKAGTDTFKEAAWQYADLDAKTNGTTYDYQNANINSLPTQKFDALTGIGNDDGFTLNTASLRVLNNKAVNTQTSEVLKVEAGSDKVTGNYIRSSNVDEASVFIMQPGEIFLVSMYYWLDGITLTEYTDTTVSQIGVQIVAAR